MIPEEQMPSCANILNEMKFVLVQLRHSPNSNINRAIPVSFYSKASQTTKHRQERKREMAKD